MAKRELQKLTTLFILFVGNSGVALGIDQVSLSEAFIAAQKRSEVLADHDEQFKQAEEHYSQAIGTVLPSITGLASITKQASSTSIYPENQRLLKASLDQPLFRGLREFSFLRQLKHLKESEQHLRADAMRALFNDLATNYMTILSYEKDLENLETEIANYNKRITELHYRIKIGRSRQTEVLTVQAVVASVKAQILQIQGALKVSRAGFQFLTGLSPETKLVNGSTDIHLASLDNYLQRIQSRPDLLAAKSKRSAAEEAIDYNGRQFYPSLDLIGNYYFYRNGALKDVPWDIGLTLSMPLYDGGIIRSRTRESESQKVQAELAEQRAQRSAEQEIHSLYETVAADLKQMEQLKMARDISEKNVQNLRVDYHNGLAANIEILQAMAARDEATRGLDRMQYVSNLDYSKLTVAAEQNEILRNGN